MWHYDVLRKQTQTTPLGITFKVKIEGKTEEQVLNAQMHSINDCPLTVKDYNDETVSVQYICAAYVNDEFCRPGAAL